ncbi:MAG: DUF1343 domain-containing protein [Deltaproteobacteria bacterium]|nr:DUF1343 domain-containing protein [Deltaproteobacteria bacterium]
MVKLGLEDFIESEKSLPAGCRAAFLTHQAAVDSRGITSLARVRRAFPHLVQAVWSPQHGFYGDRQANMIASENFSDPLSGLPVYSLYGETRQPTPEMLAGIDLVLVDLVDVGCRVYTYIWTLYLVMKAAAAAGVKVIVLDRPNPLGGDAVEGNLLDPEYSSFVGLYPLPMRHGLTLAELAYYFKYVAGIEVDLDVFTMAGWRRRHYFDKTGLFWVLPSPNMPSLESALVYPGQVLLEGTNLSEGRGTTLPFALCGAPFIDPRALRAEISPQAVQGVFLRPTWFTPTFDKWSGELCGGLQLHVLERKRFAPYRFSLELIKTVIRLYPESFQWLAPPYEYEYEKLPIDILTGDPRLRRTLENDGDLDQLQESWVDSLEDFYAQSSAILIYN